MSPDTDHVPEGQRLVPRLPVLHYGAIPWFDATRWDFRIFGELEQELGFSHEEFMASPNKRLVLDIHCVTTLEHVGHGVRGSISARAVRASETVSRSTLCCGALRRRLHHQSAARRAAER
jgi:hypothetical protein